MHLPSPIGRLILARKRCKELKIIKLELVKKLKVIKNITRKSARQLLAEINKPYYKYEITNKGVVRVKTFKSGVPMSLNKGVKPAF